MGSVLFEQDNKSIFSMGNIVLDSEIAKAYDTLITIGVILFSVFVVIFYTSQKYFLPKITCRTNVLF